MFMLVVDDGGLVKPAYHFIAQCFFVKESVAGNLFFPPVFLLLFLLMKISLRCLLGEKTALHS